MWLRRTYSFCCPGSPTDVSLPGWQPVPSALGWMSAMHATAACDHSGVVLLGRCCTSLDCCLFAPTVLATSRYGLLRAYTGEAGRLKRNCFESVGDSSRAGGEGLVKVYIERNNRQVELIRFHQQISTLFTFTFANGEGSRTVLCLQPIR